MAYPSERLYPCERLPSDYPSCLAIVEARVKPFRQRIKPGGGYVMRNPLPQKWWVYNCPRLELYTAIKEAEHVMIRAEVADRHSVAVVRPNIVFSHTLYVFIPFSWAKFAVFQSTLHEVWARCYASSMRTDMRYTTADCFDTFPFPIEAAENHTGESFYEHRRQIMLARHEGLTKIANRLHDPDEASADIQKLRQLHVEMDQAVAAAYGWTDLDLAHGFHQMRQGLRFTISETARCEVLARLLKLNHERYAEEVKQGLHDSKAKRATPGGKQKPKKVTTKSAPAAVTQTLFDVPGVDTAFPSTNRDRLLCGLLCDLVATQPGLPATAYLDALVIALSYQRHNRLLIDKDRTQFTSLAEALLTTKNQTDASILWSDMLDLLTQHDAVSRSGSTLLERGSRYDEVRRTYPACDSKLVQLIHKAAATLREFQSPDMVGSADGQEVLSDFNEDKRTLCGATS